MGCLSLHRLHDLGQATLPLGTPTPTIPHAGVLRPCPGLEVRTSILSLLARATAPPTASFLKKQVLKGPPGLGQTGATGQQLLAGGQVEAPMVWGLLPEEFRQPGIAAEPGLGMGHSGEQGAHSPGREQGRRLSDI